MTARWRNPALVLVAGFCILLPAILQGIPRGNDLYHHYRTTLSLYQFLENGVWYPGWNHLSTGGYGDVTFRFYPPATYYILSLLRWLTGDWYLASLFTFALLSALSGLGMYVWAKNFLSARLAMLAALLYMMAPYHVNEIYQAGMLPEYAGCAILPFVFAAVEWLCRERRLLPVLLLAVAYAALLLTHLPLAVIGSLALALYSLLRIERANYVSVLSRLAVGVVLALGASAFYWVTMVAELGWMRGNKVDPNPWFDYRYNFLFWKSVEGSTNWWANVLAVATLFMALPGLILLRNSRQLKTTPDRRARRAAAIGLLLAFLMATPISRPLWDVLPFLQNVQFPWRWLVISSLFGAVITAASLPWWRDIARGKGRPLALLAGGCLLISVAVTLSQTIRGAVYIERHNFEKMLATITESNSLFDWLPLWAATQPKAMSGEIDGGNRAVTLIAWEPHRKIIQIEAGQATEARLRTFYYPLWEASAAGVPLATRPDADGALLVSLPETAATIVVEFQEPGRRQIAAAISVLTWLGIGAALALQLRFSRRESPETELTKNMTETDLLT